MRPSRGTPTQNKVVVERERYQTAEYMEAGYFRLIKAFTPLHLTATRL